MFQKEQEQCKWSASQYLLCAHVVIHDYKLEFNAVLERFFQANLNAPLFTQNTVL